MPYWTLDNITVFILSYWTLSNVDNFIVKKTLFVSFFITRTWGVKVKISIVGRQSTFVVNLFYHRGTTLPKIVIFAQHIHNYECGKIPLRCILLRDPATNCDQRIFYDRIYLPPLGQPIRVSEWRGIHLMSIKMLHTMKISRYINIMARIYKTYYKFCILVWVYPH